MPKKYCFSCGSPNTYEGATPPKFCSKCGKSLTLAESLPPVTPKAVSLPATSSIKNEIDLEAIIEQRVKAALAKNQQLSSVEDEDLTNFTGQIPRASTKDCEINVPKFMTVADLQNRPDPIVRESQQPKPDFGKE